MKAEERVYLNKDKTKAVLDGNPEAASLLVATGQEVPKEYEELVKNMPDPDEPETENKDTGKPQEDKKDAGSLENKDAGKPPEDKEKTEEKKKDEKPKEVKFGGN